MKTVNVISIHSESGDDYVLVTKNELSDEDLETLLRKEIPSEFVNVDDEPGPGIGGGYLFAKQEKCKVL